MFFLLQAFNTLKQVGSGSDTAYLNKQTHSFGNDYSRPKTYDIPMDKSWKYLSTYTDVFATVPQQNNYYDPNIQAYPVDNENIIQTTSSNNFIPQKDASNIFNPFEKDTFSFDNTIPGKLDFDLSALLANPFLKQEAAPEYLIPDQPLEFSYGNSAPIENENITDNSTGIWGEAVSKESSMDVFQNTEKQVDPFVNDFRMEPRLYPAPSTDSLLTDTSGQSSPVSAATVSSPMNQDSPWEENNLQQLWGSSLNLDMDLFLPPPPKRINDSPEPVTMMSPQYPSSPETSYEAPSPSSTDNDDYVKPKPKQSPSAEQTKTKSTILFGKHEDDIIHKLLVPNLSTPSKPTSRSKLISMPVEEFNHLLDLAKLNDIEVAFMKEWRRRGKNKTAAQVARKRKREEVGGLESEVEVMRQQKTELHTRYDQLRSQIKSLKERSLAAERRVYKKYSRSSGQSVSRDTHLIHVSQGNKLLLVPKINSQIISVN